MGIALHPTNRDFTLGGTQDNGTNQMQTGPAWLHVDNGDGGFTLIDQNASDTTNVVMYHTYFNASDALVGFAETDVAGGGFVFRGCGNGMTSANGISCSDAVNFYAPLAQGPGNPNTVYYGTDRLYRSPDKGLNNGIVSQVPIVAGVPISSIAVSPQMIITGLWVLIMVRWSLPPAALLHSPFLMLSAAAASPTNTSGACYLILLIKTLLT